MTKTFEDVLDEYANAKGFNTFYALIMSDKDAMTWHVQKVNETWTKTLSEEVTRLEDRVNKLTHKLTRLNFCVDDILKITSSQKFDNEPKFKAYLNYLTTEVEGFKVGE